MPGDELSEADFPAAALPVEAPSKKLANNLDIALRVVEATKLLNDVVTEAYEAGLTVHIGPVVVGNTIGQRFPQQILSVEINQPLLRA